MRVLRLVAALGVVLPGIAFGMLDSGSWALDPTAQPDMVQFSLQGSNGTDSFNTSSLWNIAEMKGLDRSTVAKHDVHFTIVRDAGEIDCQGFMQNNRGAGLFTFHPNPQYSNEMAALGFSPDNDRLLAYAIHDVSLEFARSMKAAGVHGLDIHKLLEFRIHGVGAEWIRELRSAGVEANEAHDLVAFRIHGVSPEFVTGLQQAGIDVTQADKLVAFRIHGVSPEFAGQLSHLGYSHVPADQLVALRIHGVTPEYIESLRAKGLTNLTLEQVVRLRIHGID